MADLSKIKLNGTEYNLKDAEARSYKNNLKTGLGWIETRSNESLTKIYIPDNIDFAHAGTSYRTSPFLFILRDGEATTVYSTPSVKIFTSSYPLYKINSMSINIFSW